MAVTSDKQGLEILADSIARDEESLCDLSIPLGEPKLQDDVEILRHLRVVPTDSLADI